MITIITAEDYAARIDAYFEYIKGDCHLDDKPLKSIKEQAGTNELVWDRPPEPALLTGLALFLGFNSRQEFEAYERDGTHARIVRNGRLKVEAEYEKRLHQQAPTGAIFALKSLGWTERAASDMADGTPNTLRIEIVEAGPRLAGNEKDVIL